jgi:hypothetical protein
MLPLTRLIDFTQQPGTGLSGTVQLLSANVGRSGARASILERNCTGHTGMAGNDGTRSV